MQHKIKIAPVFFEAILLGEKTFEIRRDDRGYQKGDEVVLMEFDMDAGYLDVHRYTGREHTMKIGFVTSYEQKSGYVVFSLLNIGG